MNLTKQIKNDVRERMLSYAFDNKLDESKRLLAQALYEKVAVGPRMALPSFLITDNWVDTDDSVLIRCYHTRSEVGRTYGLREWFKMSAEVPVKQVDGTLTYDIFDDAPDDPVYKAYTYHNQINTQRQELDGKLRNILDAVRTDRQLLEMLPEAKDFLPQTERTVAALVPLQTLNEIRKIFQS